MTDKIMFINSLGVGGAERVFSNLINYLYNKNTDMHVVSIIKKIDYSVDSDIKIKFLSEKESLSHFKLPVYFLRFLFLCLELKPKVVQSHLFWSNYINCVCSILLGYDSQLVHCVSFDSKFKKGSVRLFHYIFCSFLLKRSTLNIFKSLEMRDEYAQLFNIPLSKTKVIYNPISFDVVRRKKMIKAKDDILNVAVIGRFHQSKRHVDLLEAAEFLKGKIVFHCVGDGALLSEFKSLVDNRGLSSSFIFYGWVQQPQTILDIVDIYLSCSESEGFPNSLIEAMCRGLPVVHSDCKTGPKEILGSVILDKELYAVREFGVTFKVGNALAVTKILSDFKEEIINQKQLSDFSLQRINQLSKYDAFSDYLSSLNGIYQ